MERVKAFLRTPLYSFAGEKAHVPSGCVVVDGRVVDKPSGGLLLETSAFYDDRGVQRSEVKLRLYLPWSKVDHLLVQDET